MLQQVVGVWVIYESERSPGKVTMVGIFFLFFDSEESMKTCFGSL
jgi:hypothetical protein